MKLTDENRVWHVTTEADCEGRTIKDFGYLKGNLIELAKQLSGLSYYSLSFREFKLAQVPANNVRKEVHINVDMMEKETLISKLKAEGYIEVVPSNYYKAVKFQISEDEVNAMKRQNALSKLTEEERKLLGL